MRITIDIDICQLSEAAQNEVNGAFTSLMRHSTPGVVDAEPKPKPKRKRRTKAEIAADKAVEEESQVPTPEPVAPATPEPVAPAVTATPEPVAPAVTATPEPVAPAATASAIEAPTADASVGDVKKAVMGAVARLTDAGITDATQQVVAALIKQTGKSKIAEVDPALLPETIVYLNSIGC